MQMILDKLTKQELNFLLRLLNAANAYCFENSTGFLRKNEGLISQDDATRFDREGEALRKRFEKNSVHPSMRPKHSLFAKGLKERDGAAVMSGWSHARKPAISAALVARKTPRSFVHAPSIIGVPAHRPPVLLNEPTDLVNWLVLRGFANGQMARFVRCKRCRKFGLRERAKQDAQFCTSACQIEFNVERKKEGEFFIVNS